MPLTIFDRFWEILGWVFVLNGEVFRRVATATGGLMLAMLVVLLAGLSLAIGQSIILFINRVSEVGSVFKIMLVFMTDKLFSFLLVLGTALLLLTSLISEIAIKTILRLVTTFQATFSFTRVDELQLTTGLQASSSILILALACCILSKILPSVSVRWGDVWLGALLAAFLLVGLQQLVSNSVITIGSQFLSYGAVGGVIILLLWIFLTCQIFLLGGVFSYVYAHLFGNRRHQRL